MTNNLPATPGPYWFREKDGDEWEPYYVTTLDGEGMICHRSNYNVTSRCLVSEMPSGQWLPDPSPDELATLRAKAEAYNKGKNLWMSFDADTNEPYAVDRDVAIVTHDTWKLLGRHPQGNMPGGFIKKRVRVCAEVER